MKSAHIALVLALGAAVVGAVALAQPKATGMAMKSVVCRAIPMTPGEEAAALAASNEADATKPLKGGYVLSALEPAGTATIACYESLADTSKLSRGAR
jgi:hypothetical protein